MMDAILIKEIIGFTTEEHRGALALTKQSGLQRLERRWSVRV